MTVLHGDRRPVSDLPQSRYDGGLPASRRPGRRRPRRAGPATGLYRAYPPSRDTAREASEIDAAVASNPGNKQYVQYIYESGAMIGPKPDFSKGLSGPVLTGTMDRQ